MIADCKSAKVPPALDVLPTFLPKRIGWKKMMIPRRISTTVASTFVCQDEKGHTHFSNISFSESESETDNKFCFHKYDTYSRRLRDCLIKRELNGNRKFSLD